MPQPSPARIVVLVSGSGTNLQALLDACAEPSYGARVVAVGDDDDRRGGVARVGGRVEQRLEVGAGTGNEDREA